MGKCFAQGLEITKETRTTSAFNMGNALLLVLLLYSGYVVSTNVNGCLEGWFEFSCPYSNANGNHFEVTRPNVQEQKVPKVSKNKWTSWKDLLLYHNTTGKHWRVFVKNLTKADFGKYECEVKDNDDKEITLKRDDNAQCVQKIQTHIGAQIRINCTSKDNFICKEEKNSTYPCEKVLSFNYNIQNVSKRDEGIYWCVYESPESDHRVTRQKIQLHVFKNKTSAPTISPTQPSHKTESVKSSTQTPLRNTTGPVYTSPQPNSQGEQWKTIVIAVVVCVAILLLAIGIFCLHKKFKFFSNPTPANKEEHHYDEIQERPQQDGSGTALKTIYATATLHNMEMSTDEVFKDNVLYMHQ